MPKHTIDLTNEANMRYILYKNAHGLKNIDEVLNEILMKIKVVVDFGGLNE